MNRSDAKIAARDVIMINILNHVFSEETGDSYRQAVQTADTEIERAFRECEEREGKYLAAAKRLFDS